MPPFMRVYTAQAYALNELSPVSCFSGTCLR
jgi:hypothetical protein